MKGDFFRKRPVGEGHVQGLSEIWTESKKLPPLNKRGRVWQLLGEASKSFWSAPVATLLSVVTSVVSIYILAAFFLLLQNVNRVLTQTQGGFTVSVYLLDSTAPEAAQALAENLKQRPEIAGVQYLTKAKALTAFKEELGERADLLEGLGENNPLPASLELKLKETFVSLEAFENLAKELRKNTLVEEVQYSQGLVGQFAALLSFFKKLAVLAVVLMLLSTGFIIASTVKLALHSRRDEVAIMRLVGATTAFVQAPCLIEGLLQGLLGAVGGLTALYFSYTLFADVLAEQVLVRVFLPDISFLSPLYLAFILVAAMGVGTLGSFLAVRRAVYL